MLRSSRLPRRRRGFALLAVMALIALVSAYLIASGLSRTDAEVTNERQRRSMDALQQAKAALITYAASTEGWQKYKGQEANQPGALPCPDRDNDGDSEGLCSSALTRIGRLPWKTIGSDDLRDDSGERLWYAVSSNFYKAAANVVNSDTRGLLTVTGTAPASNVVAIVFAPGGVVEDSTLPGQIQDRSPANLNRVASYLEGYTAGASDYTFTTSASPSATFNDRLLVITQADVMSIVEPAVAARIEREVKPLLQTYFSQWGAFPFPAVFAAPSPGDNSNAPSSPPQPRTQSAYTGNTAESSGLLPLTASLTYPWNAVAAPAKVSGTGNVSSGGTPCVAVGAQPHSWRCTFTISGQGFFSQISNLRVRVLGGVGGNAGISFAALAPVADIVTEIDGAGSTFSSVQYGGSLTGAGVGTVSYEATLPTWCFFCAPQTVRIFIPAVTVSALTGSGGAAGWFIDNQWYRQTYYAVSPGHLPGGAGSCNPLPGTPSCLKVNDMPAYYAAPNDNKRAILILAGRSLNGSARPSATLSDYLESANSAPADFTFEHRAGFVAAVNDRVVVVSP